MRASVTTIEAFRLFTVGRISEHAFVSQLRREESVSERMLLGSAFGAVLAGADVPSRAPNVARIPGGYEVDGFRFDDDVVEPALDAIDPNPAARRAAGCEVKGTKDYAGGALTVATKADWVLGSHVQEFKVSGSYVAEKYLGSYQWRFMADIFRARRVTYRIFRLRRSREGRYSWGSVHTLPLASYFRVSDDCEALVERFLGYVRAHRLEGFLPDRPDEVLRGPVFEDSPTRVSNRAALSKLRAEQLAAKQRAREVPLFPATRLPEMPPVADLPPASFLLRPSPRRAPSQPSLF